MDIKSGFKLTMKPIVNEVWGYRISQTRLREIRTRLILRYGHLLEKTNETKEVIEDLTLQIDLDQRKYFKVQYFDSNFIQNLNFPTTAFEA